MAILPCISNTSALEHTSDGKKCVEFHWVIFVVLRSNSVQSQWVCSFMGFLRFPTSTQCIVLNKNIN